MRCMKAVGHVLVVEPKKNLCLYLTSVANAEWEMNSFSYGAFGALVPSFLSFYTKKIIEPLLTFNTLQYVLAVLTWAIVAGLVARIAPFKFGKDARWNAFVIGLTLPIILSGLVSVVQRTVDPSMGLKTRGSIELQSPDQTTPPQQGTLLDLLSIY